MWDAFKVKEERIDTLDTEKKGNQAGRGKTEILPLILILPYDTK